jgi:hypothetical protein
MGSKNAELTSARNRERKSSVCVSFSFGLVDQLSSRNSSVALCKTVKETIDCKEQEGATDAGVWKYLESMLEARVRHSHTCARRASPLADESTCLQSPILTMYSVEMG